MSDLVTKLTALADLIRTQDNRITNLPIFVVQQRRRIFGMDPDYTEGRAWIYDDGCDEVRDTDEIARYDALEAKGEETRGVYRIGYVDVWEHCTSCLTEEAAKAYLRVNGHNLHSPRIYVESGYRNAEWEFLRELPVLVLAEFDRLEREHQEEMSRTCEEPDDACQCAGCLAFADHVAREEAADAGR